LKRSNRLIGALKTTIWFLNDQKGSSLLIESTKAHIAGFVEMAEDFHSVVIS
jgi:hypothetical protein